MFIFFTKIAVITITNVTEVKHFEILIRLLIYIVLIFSFSAVQEYLRLSSLSQNEGYSLQAHGPLEKRKSWDNLQVGLLG